MAQMFQTLARTMAHSETLKAECACGRRTTWLRAEAFKVFGNDSTPTDVRRRLRCKDCGRSGWATVWI
jgi:hypothetical protein